LGLKVLEGKNEAFFTLVGLFSWTNANRLTSRRNKFTEDINLLQKPY
jgi:hypothetical protein